MATAPEYIIFEAGTILSLAVVAVIEARISAASLICPLGGICVFRFDASYTGKWIEATAKPAATIGLFSVAK